MQDVIFKTNGSGYWSDAKRAVRITDMQLGYISDDLEFGELRVYFDTNTWNTYKDGLIYTDQRFLKELRNFLKKYGFRPREIYYSEQGMQGDDYVSCDITENFLKKWATMFGYGTVEKMLDAHLE